MTAKVKAMAVTLMVTLIALLAGTAVYAAFRQGTAVALGDCKSLQTMLHEELVARKGHIKDSAVWLNADNRVKDVQNAMNIAGCASSEPGPSETPSPEPSPTPTPEPSPTPTLAPAPEPTKPVDGEYACRPTFYNEREGKSGPYSFGLPVTQTGLEEVVQELKDRTWCDPALLVETLWQFDANSVSALDEFDRWELSTQLSVDARNDINDKWDELHQELTVILDDPSTERKLDELPTGKYMSRQMVPDDEGRAPRVENISVNRKVEWDILRVTLPDGTVVLLRLECGFQAQIPREDVPGGTPRLREDIPRDEEGKPKPEKKPEPSPTAEPTPGPSETPTPEPSPTPTPTPEPTPTPTSTPTPEPSPTPTPSKTLEPKGESTVEPGAPKATQTEKPQESAKPVRTSRPGGGGVTDSPTRAPGSESGVTAPGASPAPTTTRDVVPQEDGANDPSSSGTTCVPAPGEDSC